MSETAGAARDLWFLNTSVVIRVSHADGADGISVLEHIVPHGDSPPLHVHRDEDEVFHILEGDLRFVVGGKEFSAGAGETLIAPKGTPHTYIVESRAGARWLIVTAGKSFENFVREVGRPAERDGLPDHAGPPTPDEIEALAAIARKHGIELVGPPLARSPRDC